MFYADNPAVIEASDIEEVASASDRIYTLADGRQAFIAVLVLSPHTGKRYGSAEGAKMAFPTHMSVTDGANHRLLPFKPHMELPWETVADEAESEPEMVSEDGFEGAEALEVLTAPETGVPNEGIQVPADGEDHGTTLAPASEEDGAETTETGADTEDENVTSEE